MSQERPAFPPCRESPQVPCRVEQWCRESLSQADPRLATALQDEAGNPLFGGVACLAALRSRTASVDPALAAQVGEIAGVVEHAVERSAELACDASDYVASRYGLALALQLRFRNLGRGAAPACDLVLQEDADQGLAPDEHRLLLHIAEEAVGQVSREGASSVRILLRRSRLGPAELSVAGHGVPDSPAEVAASFRSLAQMRQLAARIDARLNVRRLDEGGLFVRCSTRWIDAGTGRWNTGR